MKYTYAIMELDIQTYATEMRNSLVIQNQLVSGCFRSYSIPQR